MSMITLLHPRYQRSKLSKKQFTLELLWELPKDWNLPLPCHKVVAINSATKNMDKHIHIEKIPASTYMLLS